MNLDDLGDFPRSPPYFGYNSAGPENPVLCIFSFQGPIRTQIDRGFFEDQYFPKYDDTRLWNEANGDQRGDRHQVARPSKLQDGSLDLKPPYIKVPDASRDGGGV